MTGKPENAPVRASSNSLGSNATRPANPTEHTPCMSICTCGACGEAVTSTTAFDQHQVTDYSRRLAVRPPAEAGLVRGDNGRWHVPSEDGAERLALLRRTR